MLKKILAVLVIIGFLFSSINVFATEKKLKKETEINVCSELSLSKGTIIRTSNFSVLSNSNNPSEPKYENLFSSNKNDIVIQLNEDAKIYLTNGGYYSKKYTTVSDYLGDLKKIGYEVKNLSIHLINQNEILRLRLEHSKQMEKYYMNIASDYGMQISTLKKEIEKLKYFTNDEVIIPPTDRSIQVTDDNLGKWLLKAGTTVVGKYLVIFNKGTYYSYQNFSEGYCMITFNEDVIVDGRGLKFISPSKEEAERVIKDYFPNTDITKYTFLETSYMTRYSPPLGYTEIYPNWGDNFPFGKININK